MRFLQFRLAFPVFLIGLSPSAYSSGPSCFGQEVRSLNIPQFPEVHRQEGGTCYSYAATGNVEAALFRQNAGKSIGLHPLLASTAHCATNSGAEEIMRGRLTDNGIGLLQSGNTTALDSGWITPSTDALLGLGVVSTQASSNALQKNRAIDDLLNRLDSLSVQHLSEKSQLEAQKRKITRERSGLNGALNIKLNKQKELIAAYENASDEDEKEKIFKEMTLTGNEIDSLQKKIEALFEELVVIYKSTETLEQKAALKACEESHCTLDEIKSLAQNSDDTVDLGKLRARQIALHNQAFAARAECSEWANQATLNKLMKNLCLGVPVSSAVEMKHMLVKDHNGVWSPGTDGSHAMVIDGIIQHDGKPHFSFRNSWGADNDLLLPVSKACRIMEAVAVYPREALPGEEHGEALLSLNVTTDAAPTTKEELAAQQVAQNRAVKQWLTVEYGPTNTTTHVAENLEPAAH